MEKTVIQSSAVFAFEVSVAGDDMPGTVVNAHSHGQAKALKFRAWDEYVGGLTFTKMRAKKVGPPHTSAAFLSTAKYRGMPDLRCGEAVTVNGRPGVVVGSNDSANFDVLFDQGCDWAGSVLNVHPSELVRQSKPMQGAR